MTRRIYLIVEGDGEETGAPLLVGRILHKHFQRYDVVVKQASNAKSRNNITKGLGLERFLERLRREPACDGVLVLLDAEREAMACPPQLAYGLADRTHTLNLPFPVAIVCAVCEYKSWFLANLDLLTATYLKPTTTLAHDPETVCNAKEWLTKHFRKGILQAHHPSRGNEQSR